MTECPHKMQWNAERLVWQTTDPATSRAMLEHSSLGVRPRDQPVPEPLRGSVVGGLFQRWVRQRDDAGAHNVKKALTAALLALPSEVARAHAREQACIAMEATWDHWAWATSVSTVASLLGIPMADLGAQQSLRQKMAVIARALSSHDGIELADSVCASLLDDVTRHSGPLAQLIGEQAPAESWESPSEYAANLLALLWQSYEAGAALMSNALARYPELADNNGVNLPGWLRGIVAQGGAVRITRRYAVESMSFGDACLEAGQIVEVDLLDSLGFGAGKHQCPGESLAMTIATTAFECLLEHKPAARPTINGLQRLSNADIPLFADEGAVA